MLLTLQLHIFHNHQHIYLCFRLCDFTITFSQLSLWTSITVLFQGTNCYWVHTWVLSYLIWKTFSLFTRLLLLSLRSYNALVLAFPWLSFGYSPIQQHPDTALQPKHQQHHRVHFCYLPGLKWKIFVRKTNNDISTSLKWVNLGSNFLGLPPEIFLQDWGGQNSLKSCDRDNKWSPRHCQIPPKNIYL